MAEELKRYLKSLLSMVDGLCAVIVTDRDGVPLIRVSSPNAPELAMRSNFLSIFGTAIEQSSKLGLGQNKAIISIYGNYQVICMNKLPLVVTMIARSSSNTGMMLSLENELSEPLQVLKQVVEGL